MAAIECGGNGDGQRQDNGVLKGLRNEKDNAAEGTKIKSIDQGVSQAFTKHDPDFQQPNSEHGNGGQDADKIFPIIPRG